VCVVYLGILIGMQKASGVPYGDLAKNADDLLKGILIPVVIGSVLLTGFAVWSGWWSDVWVDPYRIVGHTWLPVVPGILVVQIALNLTQNKFGDLGGLFVVYAAIATAFVGYSEELLTRGLLVRGLRGSGCGEIWVFVISSVVFGALHGANILNGQSAKTTIVQVDFAALWGGALFITLRKTGYLVVTVVIHALWDFALVTQGHVNAEVEGTGAVQVVAGILLWVSVVLVVIAIRYLPVKRPAVEPAT
jgi:membrane protease YdiL (CAAX protease family)